MILRPALLSDIPAMHRVRLAVRENRLSPTTRISEGDYIPAITEKGRGWVVEVNGDVVGFCVGFYSDGNIWALFVDPEHEQKGYGKQLLSAVVAWLWSQGLVRLWLITTPHTRAEKFYLKAGWQLCGMSEKGEVCFELLKP